MARLMEKYRKEIVPHLMKRFGYKNVNQVPRLDKVVINMGVGESKTDPKLLDSAIKDLTTLSGQKAVPTLAKQSVASFKLRQGQKIGCKVTLRNKRAYEFLDRFINLAIPRIKDFRGMPSRCDGRGNYSVGLSEQTVFPEIRADKTVHVQGMHITVVMKNSNDEVTVEFLKMLNFPFRRS